MGKPHEYPVLAQFWRTTQLYTQRIRDEVAPSNHRFTFEALYQFFRSEFGFSSSIRHIQDAPAQTWTINHNLLQPTVVQAFIAHNGNFVEIEAEIQQPNLAVTILKFAQPEQGYAILTT